MQSMMVLFWLKVRLRCYSEIVGGASMTEAGGMFSIEEDGQPLVDLLGRSLQGACLSADDIDVVVAHGNGNKKSDQSEAQAITQLFNDPMVTAFKWAMGHTIAASGILDTVLLTQALETHCVPGVASLQQLALSCEGLNMTQQSRSLSADSGHHGLVINRGFGGMNACIVVKSCD